MQGRKRLNKKICGSISYSIPLGHKIHWMAFPVRNFQRASKNSINFDIFLGILRSLEQNCLKWIVWGQKTQKQFKCCFCRNTSCFQLLIKRIHPLYDQGKWIWNSEANYLANTRNLFIRIFWCRVFSRFNYAYYFLSLLLLWTNCILTLDHLFCRDGFS